jgi:leucine dehydrogenase
MSLFITKLIISELVESKIEKILHSVKAEVVDTKSVFSIDAEIFSPCAIGAVLNDDSIPQMKYEIIAGSANNQLGDEERHGKMLLDNNILYAPDYVINAGGLMNVANELEGYRQDRALKHADGIYDILMDVIKISNDQKIPTYQASNKIAEERLKNIGGIKKIYT